MNKYSTVFTLTPFDKFLDPRMLGFDNSSYSDVKGRDCMRSSVVLCDFYLSIDILMLTISLFTITTFIKRILTKFVEGLSSKHSFYRIQEFLMGK